MVLLIQEHSPVGLLTTEHMCVNNFPRVQVHLMVIEWPEGNKAPVWVGHYVQYPSPPTTDQVSKPTEADERNQWPHSRFQDNTTPMNQTLIFHKAVND